MIRYAISLGDQQIEQAIEAIAVCRNQTHLLDYIEEPCGGEQSTLSDERLGRVHEVSGHPLFTGARWISHGLDYLLTDRQLHRRRQAPPPRDRRGGLRSVYQKRKLGGR